MDLSQIVRRLRKESEMLESIIASLEQLEKSAAVLKKERVKKRRGRKFMDAKDRQEVSARMKKYWAARRNRDSTV